MTHLNGYGRTCSVSATNLSSNSARQDMLIFCRQSAVRLRSAGLAWFLLSVYRQIAKESLWGANASRVRTRHFTNRRSVSYDGGSAVSLMAFSHSRRERLSSNSTMRWTSKSEQLDRGRPMLSRALTARIISRNIVRNSSVDSFFIFGSAVREERCDRTSSRLFS